MSELHDVSRSEEENERQRKQLDAVLNPEVRLRRAGLFSFDLFLTPVTLSVSHSFFLELPVPATYLVSKFTCTKDVEETQYINDPLRPCVLFTIWNILGLRKKIVFVKCHVTVCFLDSMIIVKVITTLISFIRN